MNIINQDIDKRSAFLEKIVYQALELTRKYSQESEVSIIKTTGITVNTLGERIENAEFNDNEVLKVIVFLNKKKGVAFSNNLNMQAVVDTINAAVNIASYTSKDKCSGISDQELLSFDPIYLDLLHPIKLDINFGIKLASQAEKIALQYDKRIICTEGSRFNSYVTTKVFGNSHGMLSSYSSSQHALYCSVIAERDGIMQQNYAYTLNRVFNKLNTPEWVGQESARRAIARLGSKKIKTMKSKVLFASEIATSLFQHLSSAIQGNNVYRKSTFLLHQLGKKIFPSWISIKELPHVSRELGSAPFDNEGVKTSNKLIIKNGVLNSWLLDTYSARKINFKNTGNSGGIYNWYVSCHNISFYELIEDMQRGLIVTDLMGQGVNIVTGHYSRGICGFWVENGEIQYPVNEVAISGNLMEMFSNIVAISNDIETRTNIRCGSVLIDSMQIAGI
ncbi:PmbA protein; putative modulatory Zn-dependent protease [Candidatus Blochmanniella floridana]|uniref:PmbA protein putative modulatory Zn-dependent protease n=1 Tax=Blochmanniella floridana TaxID=203907 RepID=Q7VRC0_BLOFL|nr:PmbA protein; putative modulatory Zn-dependent protease [Candidatus Blochmannia floridanus]